jgi:hypothetical protein
MFDLRIDLSSFERRAAEMTSQIDQLPFALSKSMNEAAQKTREKLVNETWPSHVQVRNKRFIGAALRIDYSTKRKLLVAISNKGIPDRGHLNLHAKGGVKQARGRLAIPPPGAVTRTAKGVRADQKPRAIVKNTPKRALRVTPKGIFVGKGGRLNLKYSFKSSASQPKDVPFIDDFIASMQQELRLAFPAAMRKALRSRRSR